MFIIGPASFPLALQYCFAVDRVKYVKTQLLAATWLASAFIGTTTASVAQQPASAPKNTRYAHVPLISVDGLQAVDLTRWIAPTVLHALGLNPRALQAVKQEGTVVLAHGPGRRDPFGRLAARRFATVKQEPAPSFRCRPGCQG